MTESELRRKVATWLDSYLGCAEGSAKHREILSIFNNSRLCTRYTMTVNDAWCATAVSAAFIACGLTSIFPCVECSCNNMITKAKNAGIWIENDAIFQRSEMLFSTTGRIMVLVTIWVLPIMLVLCTVFPAIHL